VAEVPEVLKLKSAEALGDRDEDANIIGGGSGGGESTKRKDSIPKLFSYYSAGESKKGGGKGEVQEFS